VRFVTSFARFWWNFVVGDDWTVAVGIVAALGIIALLTHHEVNAWWLMPIAVVTLLSFSLWRARER
jgi:hypothetical protein